MNAAEPSPDFPNIPPHIGPDYNIAQLFPPRDRNVVYGVPTGQEFGRRLYIHQPDGTILAVTGSSILSAGGHKVYQLTSGSAFSGREGISPRSPKSTFLHDLSYDLSSDSGAASTVDHAGQPNKGQGDSSASSDTLTVGFDVGDGEEENVRDRELPVDAVRVGTLVTAVQSGADGFPDCALIELEIPHRSDCNDVVHSRGSDIKRRVRQVGRIRPYTARVVVVTPSGPIAGWLLPTALHLRPSGQVQFQRTYEVLLDHRTLECGDVGAGVIDSQLGCLYGHVVAGQAGSRNAYIIPAADVFGHLAGALDSDVFFASPATANSRGGGGLLEPQAVQELGSRQYWSRIRREDAQNRKRKWYQKVLPRSIIRGTGGYATALVRQKPHPVAEDPSAAFRFEELFFRLPEELQIDIVTCLPPRSIICLRNTSKRWRGLVSENEGSISSGLLKRRPPPSLVRRLRLQDEPMGLDEVFEIWHRTEVAMKLAAHMADWMAKEI